MILLMRFVVVCGCLWLFVVVCGCLWLSCGGVQSHRIYYFFFLK